MEDTEISTLSIDFHINKLLSTMIKTEFFSQNLQNLTVKLCIPAFSTFFFNYDHNEHLLFLIILLLNKTKNKQMKAWWSNG